MPGGRGFGSHALLLGNFRLHVDHFVHVRFIACRGKYTQNISESALGMTDILGLSASSLSHARKTLAVAELYNTHTFAAELIIRRRRSESNRAKHQSQRPRIHPQKVHLRTYCIVAALRKIQILLPLNRHPFSLNVPRTARTTLVRSSALFCTTELGRINEF